MYNEYRSDGSWEKENPRFRLINGHAQPRLHWVVEKVKEDLSPEAETKNDQRRPHTERAPRFLAGILPSWAPRCPCRPT